MAYISKKDILAAYKKLSEMHPDPNVQGATQKVSAIRYFFALDAFYKQFGRECDTRNKTDKEYFARLVGNICDVCLDLYTTNFYYPLKEHSGDYSVGSNFFSAGQVNASIVNPNGIFDYPKRGSSPLFKIHNGVLRREVALYPNLKSYLPSTDYIVALIVWLVRKTSIEIDNGKSLYLIIRSVLSKVYTEELIDVLFENEEEEEKALNAYKLSFNENFYSIRDNDIKELFEDEHNAKKHKYSDSYQLVFYGAPGTGKSHTINEVTRGEDVIRTTFHPDTDYSSFVGAYKPTTSLLPICNELGEPMKIANQALYKEQIVYEFVAQSFLHAYIAAWKKYAEAGQGEPKKQFLVIEEINRGNCAQIFGDLFQLLDRNDHGFSEYPIKADADMKKQLQKAFKGLDIQQKDSINAMYGGRDVVREVMEGDLLLLPNNLYIWATMNTSDQSLFPIDSAFKRRWDWTYIPISNASKGWTINIGDARYDWWQFVEKVNALIGSTTYSEDKKLGYFFCKAKGGVISAETFVGKVIFYLWNDVFKDYDFSGDAFKDVDGNKLTFDKFYTAEGNNSKVVEEKVELFLKNLGLEASVQQGGADEYIDSKTIIKVNGKDVAKVNAIPYTAIEEYVRLHPEMSAQDVINIWDPFKKHPTTAWIVCNKEELDGKSQNAINRTHEIKCKDGSSLWVTTNGWTHNPEKKEDNISEFIEAVNNADLGITITETIA